MSITFVIFNKCKVPKGLINLDSLYFAFLHLKISVKTLLMHFQLLTFLDLNMGQLESQMQ